MLEMHKFHAGKHQECGLLQLPKQINLGPCSLPDRREAFIFSSRRSATVLLAVHVILHGDSPPEDHPRCKSTPILLHSPFALLWIADVQILIQADPETKKGIQLRAFGRNYRNNLSDSSLSKVEAAHQYNSIKVIAVEEG
ncbi:hypothetical protein KSP40_PGU005419 [Platanthera guangdongensis]|uniref:Uncharacterized protein n=1 Tax=Platanthera guangdongensis TaxID=2320717 RepID=A0ABR2MDI4_9ASPA